MRRAALYARFSTEMQADRSVDDQLKLCEEFASRQGLSVVGRYEDRARSGTTTFGRDGLSRLLQDARDGAFEVIVVEALDRLSRDQEDLAGLHKRLTFMGVEIIAVHDGRADALQVGIRGLVSSLWITDLKHKIRRGMQGRVKDGKLAGGRAYGYRPTHIPGKPQIIEEEAAVIRRIFADYLAGIPPRDIAHALNADDIPGPRGAKWTAATINGNTKRGHGILQNPLYAGRLVWNRVRMVRDPDTGKRVSRQNPKDQWQEAHVPELAIIDPATWAAAQERKAERAHLPNVRQQRNPKRILSGLLRCGKCGGGMSAHDRRAGVVRIRCTTHTESGSCDNARRYRLDKIEAVVIEGIAARLRDPAGLQAYIDGYQEEQRADSAARARLEREANACRAKIKRMAMMVVEGRVADNFFDKEIAEGRSELAALEARLAAAPKAQVVVLHPAAVAAYRDGLARLGEILTDPENPPGPDLVAAFRELIDRVVIHDRQDASVECEVIGCFGPLVGSGPTWGGRMVAGDRPPNSPPKDGLGGAMVAGDRSPSIPPMMWGRFVA